MLVFLLSVVMLTSRYEKTSSVVMLTRRCEKNPIKFKLNVLLFLSFNFISPESRMEIYKTDSR